MMLRRDRLSLDDQVRLEAALRDAFAPLRARRAPLSAARVRAAVRWEAPPPPRLGGLALIGRLGELSTVMAVAAIVFAGALSPALPTSHEQEQELVAPVLVPLNGGPSLNDPATYMRWLRLGRSDPQDDLLDPATGMRRTVLGTDGPLAHERQGLAIKP